MFPEGELTMPYAISNDGRSWRAIQRGMELMPEETYSDDCPPELPPTAHELEMVAAESQAVADYATLPDWARTASADAAETYINGQIWGGADYATVSAYIDAQIPAVTGGSLTTALASINTTLVGVRTVLKAAAGAILTMRGLFVLTSKLLIYIRDLVIRWRT
jgi:hypothetical protein